MHIATMTALLAGTEEPRAQSERTMSDSCGTNRSYELCNKSDPRRV
jgi:hypothetical protein